VLGRYGAYEEGRSVFVRPGRGGRRLTGGHVFGFKVYCCLRVRACYGGDVALSRLFAVPCEET